MSGLRLLKTSILRGSRLKRVRVDYTNYRGEFQKNRLIIPLKLIWGENEYHPTPQWLLEVFDEDKDALRIYALKDCTPSK